MKSFAANAARAKTTPPASVNSVRRIGCLEKSTASTKRPPSKGMNGSRLSVFRIRNALAPSLKTSTPRHMKQDCGEDPERDARDGPGQRHESAAGAAGWVSTPDTAAPSRGMNSICVSR